LFLPDPCFFSPDGFEVTTRSRPIFLSDYRRQNLVSIVPQG
jgi:hypothetical protein